MRNLLLNPRVSLLSRAILGGVFLYAGATKIFDPGGLAASIRSYELSLPEWFVSLSAYSLPYLEVMLGLYLLAGLFTRVSALVTSGLMVVFILALLQGALRGIEVDCGCFGTATGATSVSLWAAFARDLGLLALGLQLVLAPLGRLSVDEMLRQSPTRTSSEEEGLPQVHTPTERT